MEILSSIGIMTFKIPDLTDPQKKAMLPPSQNKPTAGLLLRGCAQVEEPLAIIHIMTAVYMSATLTEPSIKELGSLFPRSEVIQYRKTLAKLASSSKPFPLQHEALTLEGQFLEREGKQDKAAPLYVKAITLCPSKFDVTNRHPMQLPLIAPWNALGLLYKQRDTPSAQIEAKKVFAKGAFVGDDPFSYYQLASFEDRTSPQWLQYTSKAAASGHRQAMVDLADFYQEVDLKDSPVLVKSSMRNILNWLLGWRRGSASALAREWLQAASNIGHLPSTLQLADYHSLPITLNSGRSWFRLRGSVLRGSKLDVL
jgi:TPR repeat protein